MEQHGVACKLNYSIICRLTVFRKSVGIRHKIFDICTDSDEQWFKNLIKLSFHIKADGLDLLITFCYQSFFI